MRWIDDRSTDGWRFKRRCWMAAIAVGILMLLILGESGAGAQGPVFHRDVVVIDAAHGGADDGVRITDSLAEKDVTLALAARLESLLAARGFTVVATRDGAAGAGLSTDQRADLANKARAVACLVLHASASGNGIEIGTSAIGSPLAGVAGQSSSAPPTAGVTGAVAWDRAQEVYLSESLRLANKVGTALTRSNIPLTIRRVALRPLDNLICPAISVELQPQANAGGGDPVPVSDGNYQQRVAEAIAGALVFWRNQAQPPEYRAVPNPEARAKPDASMAEPAGASLLKNGRSNGNAQGAGS